MLDGRAKVNRSICLWLLSGQSLVKCRDLHWWPTGEGKGEPQHLLVTAVGQLLVKCRDLHWLPNFAPEK